MPTSPVSAPTGRSSWVAEVHLGDQFVRSREVSGGAHRGLAVSYVNRHLNQLARAGTRRDLIRGRIRRGTYLDGIWTADVDEAGRPVQATATLAADGTIEWV